MPYTGPTTIPINKTTLIGTNLPYPGTVTSGTNPNAPFVDNTFNGSPLFKAIVFVPQNCNLSDTANLSVSGDPNVLVVQLTYSGEISNSGLYNVYYLEINLSTAQAAGISETCFLLTYTSTSQLKEGDTPSASTSRGTTTVVVTA